MKRKYTKRAAAEPEGGMAARRAPPDAEPPTHCAICFTAEAQVGGWEAARAAPAYLCVCACMCVCACVLTCASLCTCPKARSALVWAVCLYQAVYGGLGEAD